MQCKARRELGPVLKINYFLKSEKEHLGIIATMPHAQNYYSIIHASKKGVPGGAGVTITGGTGIAPLHIA